MVTVEPGTRRSYRSERREASARRTRQQVLVGATRVFLERGWVGATVRAIAAEAGVAVPTVEALFGTKAAVLAAAVDVAIAGDDEPVPVLQRDWTRDGVQAADVQELLEIVAGVLAAAQERSAGLVVAVFDGAARDPQLAALAEQMVTRRAGTAGWLVDAIAAKASLHPDLSRSEAVDTLWALMDPALFLRLTRDRHWDRAHYQRWLQRALARLLLADRTAPPTTRSGPATTPRPSPTPMPSPTRTARGD